MLLGTYTVTFSSKHRVAIPSQFRKDLGEKFILAKWYEGCLVLVSNDFWSALWQRLTGKEEIIVSQIRDTERFIMASAYEMELDDQGRIVIPEKLVLYAGLGEGVSFLGLGDRVEIWDEAKWSQKEKLLVSEAPKLIDKLANDRR
ncbi:MAG: division/cell wall cluster transcriptional repressor MraZ [Candidatus Woesebacteria bacterium]|nr:division/cell wall cluster transcriptional repressor MraZ [Candidatus Woesebacteria bacterium]